MHNNRTYLPALILVRLHKLWQLLVVAPIRVVLARHGQLQVHDDGLEGRVADVVRGQLAVANRALNAVRAALAERVAAAEAGNDRLLEDLGARGALETLVLGLDGDNVREGLK
jgi:hypothetical protein